MSESEPKYEGKREYQPEPGELDKEGRILYPYLPDDELVKSVEYAILLERPLLITGEPGCGKTRLAGAVAYEFTKKYEESLEGESWPYEEWYIKSTSQVRDGFYRYDALRRLRDAQLAMAIGQTQANKVDDINAYVSDRALGKAFKSDKRTVVLIDEIDKADLDFQNDLLLELDEKRFLIEETDEWIPKKEKGKVRSPIVFITCNDTSSLSEPFLRRCIVHKIEFPDEERLKQIIDLHFKDAEPDLVDKAVERFQELRDGLEGFPGKNVSTSELIDWFKILKKYPKDEVLEKLEGQIPYARVLLKKWEEHLEYLKETGTKIIIQP